MSFARQKRLLLGALAALAPLPLPFNSVVSWAVVLLFWLVVALFLVRAWKGSESWLSPWAMNLLALGYLPFFFSDITLFWRGQVLQPLAHLAMFTLAVKLFALKREQDKWHALLAAFFLFLAAMGSSVHPTVVFYQLGMLVLGTLTLVRFAGYHEESKVTNGGRAERAVPVAGFVVKVALMVLLAAVPLFVLLPRLRQPYLVAPGGGGAGGTGVGFSDEITLSSIGRVRTSSAVAFRFAFDGPAPPLREFRFKVAAYDLFVANSWRRGPRASTLVRRSPDGFFAIAEGRPRAWATVWMKQTGTSRLALPVETVSMDTTVPVLVLDDTGSVSLVTRPAAAVGYRVGMERRAAMSWPAAGREGPAPADRDAAGVSRRVAELAAEVMGEEGSLGERVSRLERHLMSAYGYTLDLRAGVEQRPIERFLFETREGHCEYFASAMVLMLRSQGVPARFVTGYYGAEFNPLEEYFIVRQSNAHAWVEAFLPEEGWRVFDPTPAAGLPSSAEASWTRLFVQAYDYLLFRWDRYVLTYGFNDQAGFFFRLRDFLQDLWSRFRGDESASEEAPPGAAPETSVAAEPADEATPSLVDRYRWVPFVIIAAAALLWLWRRRGGPSATKAYRTLRSDLARRRVGVVRSTPPLEVERKVVQRCPEAAAPAGRLIALYLEESFAGEDLDESERAEVKEALGRVRRQLKKSA